VRRETPEEPQEGTSDAGSPDGMEEGWVEAIRYAELVAESGHAVGDTDFACLAEHWDPGQIVEITLVAGLFSYFNRFNDALRVEVTK
jgi:alkylhydroperoxidase family enzyme